MIPQIVDTKQWAAAVREAYRNEALARVNDHEVRISVMTSAFGWHRHPDSDETFLAVEGGLTIEFEDGAVTLAPGQLLTVPKGVRHRTRPAGARSVNLTFERSGATTEFDDGGD